ncbi:hypothetical protein AMS68_005618 [Peltaster fructicola]|uniref:Uncharacterized protein n=1 Tax=Peltaster fructicola TaxID=286661 RepID=A0A6H0XZK6_9PEZI|nr:hypothetical protein AMS68_005618 [Peltaster fructicola]
MRLIDVDEFCRSENIVVESFVGDKVPKYAILSHTWSDGEVSFSDLKNREVMVHLAGFIKISFACRQASRDGHHWLWVDTCCIDKTSSSELSEAINSMYQWYEGAEICYVHLEDLPGNCPRLREKVSEVCHSFTGVELVTTQDRASLPSKELLTRRRSLLGDLNGIGRLEERLASEEQHEPQYWIGALARCRWFTRGWTLQELIAPGEVAFFGSAWNPIAYKRHILHTISGITGIDTLVLTHQISLDELSVAKKMSWAASRATTRKEDESYCLLGVLGINMTLLYGEGDKAFTRLQEEVLRMSTDCSVFLWSRGRHSRLDSRKLRALRQPPDINRVLLAPSAAVFKPCSKITHEKRSDYECSYLMTHRGLQLDIVLMPITTDDEHEEFLGIMPCHLEDDFKHSLAIHLRKHKTGTKESMYSIERCRRECSSDLSRHGLQHFHSVKVEDRPAQVWTQVLIPRDNFQSAMSMSALEWTASVWVRSVPADFQFKYAYPQHQWNSFTLTWNRYKSLARESTSRAGGLSFTYRGTEIMICFEVYLDTGVILTLLREPGQELPQACEHVAELCTATNQLESSVTFSTVTGPDEEMRVIAKLSHNTIMGEKVWVIDMELRRTEFNVYG